MSVFDGVVDKALARMDTQERHDLLVSVVDKMLGAMSADDRAALMHHVVDVFLEGLPGAERESVVRDLVPSLLAQLMKSGNMSVDELLWAAMGSLGALEQGDAPPTER